MRAFILAVSTERGNEVENFLIDLGISPIEEMSYPYEYIVFSGSLEYFTSSSKSCIEKYPKDWWIDYNDFYNQYINVEKIRVVHLQKEDCDVIICRPSKWGNPYSHKENTLAKFKVNTREEAIESHRLWLTMGDGMYLLEYLHELRGKRLGCWCYPKKCHGDTLVSEFNKKYRK